MRGRPKINAAAPLRSSLADAAFAVEERVLWHAGDLLRGLLDAARWPFERLGWSLEEHLVWPLEERVDGWSGATRTGAAAALVLFAAGAGVLGLLWISAGGSGSTASSREVVAPAVKPAPLTPSAPASPVLHGPAPHFTPEGGDAAAKGSGGTAAASAVDTPRSSSTTTAETKISTAAKEVVDPGPAALEVARRFSGAFVLYEIGRTDAKVRAAFEATATPKLTRELLRRPPRLPANAEVPKAKVLNVVPGPRHGDTYTLSASLLRVGVTSELRIDMQRDEASGEWRVMEVRG